MSPAVTVSAAVEQPIGPSTILGRVGLMVQSSELPRVLSLAIGTRPPRAPSCRRRRRRRGGASLKDIPHAVAQTALTKTALAQVLPRPKRR